MVDASSSVWLPVLPDMSGFGPAVIKGAGKEADKQGKGIGKRFGAAINFGVATIAAGAVATGTALYKIGETFDEVRDTIRAGTGATGEDLEKLVEHSKNVGRQVPFDFETIGGAIADVDTRLGLTGPTLEKFASQMLEAGRLMGEDLDINTLSDAFNVFRLEGEETTDAMDHLFQVSQATGVGMNELASVTANAAPAAMELGFSFDQTANLVGNLDKAGLNASRMMNGLSRGLVELAKDGEEPEEAFKRVTGEMNGFIKEGDKAAAIDLASELFGTKNAPQFIAALESGALAMEDLDTVAGMTDDTILGVGEETMDFAEHWQIFKNDILTQIEPAATKLFDAISDGMKWIRENGVPILKNIGGWLQDNEGWLKGVALAIGAVVAVWKTYQITMSLVTAAQGAWNTITTIGSGIAKAFTAVTKALNAAFRANPIGLVVTVIGLLVAAFITAYKKSETFRKIVDAAWAGIKKAAEAAWNFLKKWVFEPIGKAFKAVWEAAVNAKDKMTAAWKAVQDAFGRVWNWIDDKVFTPFKRGVELVKLGIEIQVGKIKSVWEGLKNAFRAVWNWVNDKVFTPFKKGLTNLKDHVNTIKEGIGKAWKGVANFFRNPINWVLDKVWNNGIAKAYNNAASALGLKTRITTEAKIPKFAKGGLAKKGWALVGEEGPELVNFSAPGRVYTAAETRAVLGDAPSGEFATDAFPAMGGGGGGWWSRRMDDLKSIGSSAISWARGGLAKAAELLLAPIRNIIAPHVAQWGKIGDFAGGAMTKVVDSLVDWIRGKDTVPDASGDGGGPLTAGGWHRPSFGPITSRYGARPGLAGVTGSAFHNGIDIAGGGRTYAARAGTVLSTGWNILPTNSGIGILIGHGGGYATYYGHNPPGGVVVKPGQEVKGGQHIGRQGATGNVTGIHLHFGLRKNGKFINPTATGLFDGGGWLEPGMTAYHSASMLKPDAVLTADQWSDIHTLASRRGDQQGDQYVANVPVQKGADSEEIADAILYKMRGMSRGGVHAR